MIFCIPDIPARNIKRKHETAPLKNDDIETCVGMSHGVKVAVKNLMFLTATFLHPVS